MTPMPPNSDLLRRFPRITAGLLVAFIGCAFLGFLADLAEWKTAFDVCMVLMWILFPLYFTGALFSTDMGMGGWRGRVFAAGTFLFLAVFIGFALLLILSTAFYLDRDSVVKVITSPEVGSSLVLSVVTSVSATILALVFAVPMGYALSRYRFPGRLLADTLVDIPIVFPPLVAGLVLLVFFSRTGIGNWIEDDLGMQFIFDRKGIVLCQFIVSASFAIRSVKVAFDEVDRRLEQVALTLGHTPWSRFLHVSLPLAGGGVLSGGILTWARAFGIFGPLMILVGTFERNRVLSTRIFLEQSVGDLEVALAVSLLMILVALLALVTIRWVGGRAMVKL